ncbi:MAG TPA: hypothetical protein VFP60_04505 [Pseudolabrys sp.]|nr:hypothetical protein [Pseudolabrys sp.]
MRKTIILAVATIFLAGATVVAGIARTVDWPLEETILAAVAASPPAIASLTARIFNPI